MTEDERLIRTKLRAQKFDRWMRVILQLLAAAALCTLIASLVYTTWYKP